MTEIEQCALKEPDAVPVASPLQRGVVPCCSHELFTRCKGAIAKRLDHTGCMLANRRRQEKHCGVSAGPRAES
jgi:hypothetical protein